MEIKRDWEGHNGDSTRQLSGTAGCRVRIVRKLPVTTLSLSLSLSFPMYKSQQRSFPSFIGFLLFSTRLSPSLKPLQINLSLCDNEEARILGGLGGGGLRYRRLRFLLELHLQLQLSVLSPGKSGSWMLCRFSLQQGMVPAEISFLSP